MTNRTVRASALPPARGLVLAVLALLAVGTALPGAAGALAAQEPPPAPPPESEEEGAEAQEEPPGEVTLVLEDGQRPLLRLAFPDVERSGELSEPAAGAADVLEETLRNDLDASRIFEIQGPWAFTVLELTG
ncbi:MAG: hypothetical protein ACLF0P_03970, partial [Thermoanaerobaculia bacterium]